MQLAKTLKMIKCLSKHIKHVYCNRFAIEYMAKLNNFYIHIIDIYSRRYDTTKVYNESFDNI